MANDFFDKVVDSTKRAASTVAETTEMLFDKGKLKASEVQTKGDLRSEYRKLGELVYKSKKGDNSEDAQIDICVAAIDALNEKLEKIRADIELAR
jgi:hypothetical protein